SAYNPTLDAGSAQGRRWGDYSATITDGCDDNTIWTLQQYADVPNSYALQVAALRGAPPPVPVSATPAIVPDGVTSIDIAITAAGAGTLLDPGPGFACHVGASIPGVVVNRVTPTGPQSAIINISTVGTTPGSKTVTLSNPDGQIGTSTSA